jgi:hypothetical protein
MVWVDATVFFERACFCGDVHVKTNFLELANFSKAAQHLQYHEQHRQVQQENAGRCQNPKPQG